MSTETITFKLGLSGTYHDRPPKYRVLVDDTEYSHGLVSADSDKTFFVEFTCSLEENTEHCLKIRLEDKRHEDTVVEAGEIVKDQLLNIVSVSVDDLDLGSIIWSKSLYRLDQAQKFNNQIVQQLDNCVNLGWNGTYELRFSIPFYFWLLENF